MNSRLKTLLWILAGLLVLYYGVSLTNQSRMQQGIRVISNQENVESRKNENITGKLDRSKKSSQEYNTDLLKESLGDSK